MAEVDHQQVTEVVKEKPPATTKYNWTTIAEQLRADPMEWYCIFKQDRISIANAVRQGSILAVTPSLGFETTTRNNVRVPVRLCTLYMRWNPDGVDPLAASLLDNRKDR